MSKKLRLSDTVFWVVGAESLHLPSRGKISPYRRTVGTRDRKRLAMYAFDAASIIQNAAARKRFAAYISSLKIEFEVSVIASIPICVDVASLTASFTVDAERLRFITEICDEIEITTYATEDWSGQSQTIAD